MTALRGQLAAVLLGALVACGGDDVSGGQDRGSGGGDAGGGCTAAVGCAFGERCVDGRCTAEVPAPVTDDGCATNDDCEDGQQCAPSSGRCVTPSETPIPGEETPRECTEGETRPCGSKVGRCAYGVETCAGDAWSGVCVGGVGAIPEECNGIDDDCDGVVAVTELDVDGDGARGCAGDCRDDVPTTYPNAPELCDGVDNNCVAGADEGASVHCDDGLFCNGVETCGPSGACVSGMAPACADVGTFPSLNTSCTLGVCNESLDACVAANKSDGTSCDDGNFCFDGDQCLDGVCVGGTPHDCSFETDGCNDGVCDETANACVKAPARHGRTCNDGLFCTTGEACSFGACIGGAARNCADTGSCRSGVCDESLDACVGGDPINENLPCDDGQFCTNGERCLAGSCTGGGATDCSSLDNVCNDGVCNESGDRCERAPANQGGACDDALYCNIGETCQAGVCTGGAARSCTSVADTCNVGVCSEASDACVRQAANDGGTCDDGLYCTVTDVCGGGTCGGGPRNCTALSDACNTGVCNEATNACERQRRSDGTVCNDGLYCSTGETCQAGVCASGAAMDCSGLSDACYDGVCNESGDRCERVRKPVCTCNATIDADFDGSNECLDCDDSNGAIRPGATERCNGVDDDCDGTIDEGYDGDSDGYTTCASDPRLRDCNDANPAINPGATENCGTSGTGNGVDDDCDGYVDENCNPCNPVDTDGDGVSECGGDCLPTDGTVVPGGTEVCDGKDNDCNVYTIDNCDVSDPCNFPGTPVADVCRDDLLCACIVNGAGNCTGNYQCTSYCNASFTGLLGDGCAADETCSLDLLRSANVHGCNVTPDTLGAKVGGVACGGDAECRSGLCERLFTGPNADYCVDYCGSDAFCTASGTVCRGARGADNLDGRCWPTGRPGVGTTAVGTACTQDSACDHGLCLTDGASRYCTEPCCADTDCGAGFTCSLRGDQIATTYVLPPAGAPACTADAQCPAGMMCFTGGGQCAWRISETTPMCMRDVSGQGTRPGGAACANNGDCRSNFCEVSLGVCIESCCSDASCPTGLTCELQYVQTTSSLVTQARVCVNLTTDDVLLRRP